MNRDVASFDLQRELGADASHTLFKVYEGLVRLDPIEHETIKPELADKWEVSPDGRVYTFRFSKGIKWQDGQPFTMDDVLYSLDRMHNPKAYKTISPRGEAALATMDTADTVGDDTIRINLKKPSASFLYNIATGWVAMQPKHIMVAKGDMRRDLIGTGPFKLKELNANISIELAKNPDYHIKGLPYLDGIKIYTIRDQATRFSAFRTGRLKITMTATQGMLPAEAELVRREMADKVVVYDHDGQVRHTITFNHQRKPWNDVRMRKAVDLALDRQSAAKVNGRGYVGSIYVAPWGMKPEEVVKLPGYRQPKDPDIAEAKRLMAEAGYGSGLKTTMIAAMGVTKETQAVMAKANLEKIGINVELMIVDQTDLYDRAQRHIFDLCAATRQDNTNDPNEVLYTYYVTEGAGNWGVFSDKAIDELIDKQASIMDKEARKPVLAEIEKRVLDQIPMAVVFWDILQTGAWRQVRGFRPGPGIHPWGKLDRAWLAE